MRAIRAKGGAKKRRTNALIIPPVNEAVVDIFNALSASPLYVIGKPSKTVAAELGVPGTFSNMAEMDPPYMAPQYMLPKRTRP